MKAKNIVCGKELQVEVINTNYNEHAVEVKILEGNFTGKCAIVEKKDLVLDKHSISTKIAKYANEDSYERTLTTSDYRRSLEFELTIKCEDTNTQDYIYSIISNHMEKELDKYDFQFSTCPTIENGEYWESASVEYTHGSMAEVKKAIMTAYKEAKALLK